MNNGVVIIRVPVGASGLEQETRIRSRQWWDWSGTRLWSCEWSGRTQREHQPRVVELLWETLWPIRKGGTLDWFSMGLRNFDFGNQQVLIFEDAIKTLHILAQPFFIPDRRPKANKIYSSNSSRSSDLGVMGPARYQLRHAALARWCDWCHP